MLAVAQFLPCVAVGAVVTAFVYSRATDLAWMLPGLWCLLFSLGVFASYRLLPPQVFFVGLYYLGCGAACLSWAENSRDLGPWLMGGPFGTGQLFAAGILYWTLERNNAGTTET